MKFAVSAVFLLLTAVLAQPPGLQQDRITKRNLSGLLGSIIKSLRFGPFKFKFSGSDFVRLYNLAITDLKMPHVNVKNFYNNVYKLSVSGLGIDLKGVVDYKYGWFSHTAVKFTSALKRINFSLNVGIRYGAVHISNCRSSFGSVGVHFSGGWSWLYNALYRGLRNDFTNKLESMFCPMITRATERNSGTISRVLAGR